MTDPKPLDIEDGRSWLMFTIGAVIAALDKAPDLRDAFWRLIPFISALMTVGGKHPEETRAAWLERLDEPMPFGGAPVGVANALPKSLKEWNRTPVPAVEHQAIGAVADTATHQRYMRDQQRDAFIALYEAGQAAIDGLSVSLEEPGWLGRMQALSAALSGALDKAAPAYGRALVARAEERHPDFEHMRREHNQFDIVGKRLKARKETGGQ